MGALDKLGRPLRLGVIGGGPGSFAGHMHRTAAAISGDFEVVCSVLSSDPERSRNAGRALGLEPSRTYGSTGEMFAAEVARSASTGDGMDVVAIMTPNDQHYPVACQALSLGLDVVCDKPLTTNVDNALDLVRRVRKSGLVFCHTFNYSAFPLVRQARAMVRDGDLGEITQVHVEYVQGHAAKLAEGEENGRGWRADKARAGQSLILGEIGSHSQHLVSFVANQRIVQLTAQLQSVVKGRSAQDYGGVLFRLENGAPGTMWVTQAAPGAVHGLRFRIFGTEGGLEWFEEEPNQLRHARYGLPAQIFERGGPGLTPAANAVTRVAIGHPEGFLEAFATLYRETAQAVLARRFGIVTEQPEPDFPTVEDGAWTMRFIEAAVESDRLGAWVDCRLDL